jgi:type I restriction enzyme S subunit
MEEISRYEKYKDSGIQWIGVIPENWEVKRLKWIVSERLKYGANESAELDDKELPRYIRITDFGEDGKLKEETFKSLPMDVAMEYLLENGDILFARSGATVGKTFQFKNYVGQACFAGYLIKAKPNKNVIDSDFLYFFTKSDGYESWRNYIFNQATIQNIGADKYSLLEVPVPSIIEQTTIATYLDRKTTEIDRIIANKQKLIALYEEEKQAIINQAVTKGLDPNVKMKDSGVEWLGEIPEHWGVIPLTKYLDSIVDYRGRTPQKKDSGLFLVTARNIKNRIIDYSLSEEFVDPIDAQNLLERGLPKIGDVLFTTEAPLGEVANIDREDIALAQRVIKFRGIQNVIDNYYLKYFMSSDCFKQDLYTYSTGSTAIGIKASKLHQLKCLLPTFKEQQSIVAHIEKECTRLDTIIEKFTKQIDLLQEYRTTLISEVVTGKIKVC